MATKQLEVSHREIQDGDVIVRTHGGGQFLVERETLDDGFYTAPRHYSFDHIIRVSKGKKRFNIGHEQAWASVDWINDDDLVPVTKEV